MKMENVVYGPILQKLNILLDFNLLIFKIRMDYLSKMFTGILLRKLEASLFMFS